MGYPVHKFRTRNQAYQLAVKSWTCVHCERIHEHKKPGKCFDCGNNTFYKSDSRIERKRLSELLLLQEHKYIRSLETQVNFPFRVNGILVCSYRADFTYTKSEDNKFIVEDVKPISKNDIAISREFRIKEKLLGAIYGHVINIERRS